MGLPEGTTARLALACPSVGVRAGASDRRSSRHPTWSLTAELTLARVGSRPLASTPVEVTKTLF